MCDGSKGTSLESLQYFAWKTAYWINEWMKTKYLSVYVFSYKLMGDTVKKYVKYQIQTTKK